MTYDRRGNSRSPRPPGWTATSSAEQAGDAAGLVEALGLAPVTVFGSSGGAIVRLWLLLDAWHLDRQSDRDEPRPGHAAPFGSPTGAVVLGAVGAGG
ncbi:MAG: hypothetical protein H0V93_10440 [Euzebyales bacterium]|nr:hypothetical protein [Euzebyales bacterium]